MERASELLGKLAAEESLILAVFGGPRKKSQPVRKVSLRPVLLKDALHYQAEYTYEKKVTHENLLPEEVEAFAERQLQSGFKQADIFSTEADYTVLANKPDHEKILKKKPTKTMGPLAHNREKNYAIPDGTPVDFLVRLGVQTRDGQIVPKHRNKFRQINRFLEIGKIINTHGVRGEVKLEPWADSPQQLKTLKNLWLDSRALPILECRVHGRFVIVKLEGVDSVEAAMDPSFPERSSETGTFRSSRMTKRSRKSTVSCTAAWVRSSKCPIAAFPNSVLPMPVIRKPGLSPAHARARRRSCPQSMSPRADARRTA